MTIAPEAITTEQLPPMTDEQLAEIEAREQAATPGEWAWFGNTDTQQMYLATKKFGRMYVMGFRRWGLQGAQPTFCVDRTWKPDPQSGDDFGHSGTIAPAHDLASRIVRYEVAPNAANRDDPRVYRADISGIKNPDAEFIAHSRKDVADLLAEVKRSREERAQGEAAEAMLAKIKELAFIGGQNGDTVRRWIIGVFEDARRAEAGL